LPDALPRLRRLADLLAGYEVLLTPDLEPFPAEHMLTEPYAIGLFEMVACSADRWLLTTSADVALGQSPRISAI
jgi:hypothetical protein